MALDIGETTPIVLDLFPNHSTVGLELCFTGPPKTDTTTNSGQVRPHSGESREEILQLGEFDLQLGFGGSRSGREDVENHLGPVHHPDLQLSFEIRALIWGEFFVEYDEGRFT